MHKKYRASGPQIPLGMAITFIGNNHLMQNNTQGIESLLTVGFLILLIGNIGTMKDETQQITALA